MILLGVPSSTSCVDTMALASSAQKKATTRPAWTAVNTTRAFEPCSRNEPVVRSWKGRVARYMIKNVRSSMRPVYAYVIDVREEEKGAE